MEGFLLEITFIFCLAAGLAIIFSAIKLPPILGYIFAGIIIGPLGIAGNNIAENADTFDSVSKIGITLLLFILGLELRIADLKSVGKAAFVTGIGQIILTVSIGFLFSTIIGFGIVESLYLAISLTFSSTIVIVKLLSDKRELDTLYGKITVGFLLIQDFVAIFLLIILNGLNTQEGNSNALLGVIILFIKTAVIFGFVIGLSKTIIPKLMDLISKNHEVLFIFSIAWAFGIAALVSSKYIGLSLEIGGFLAGLALANSIESFHIVSKVRSLRDFFIVIFFVNLAIHLDFGNISNSIIPSIFFSIFVLVGNPLIVMTILGIMGYKVKTGFMCGLAVAQVSEFSLILLFVGKDLGHVSSQVVSIVTIVAIITFSASSYMIINADKLFMILEKYIKVFEKKRTHESALNSNFEFKDHVVIVGAHRIGNTILENFIEEKDRVLIVDFNPETAQKLRSRGFHVLFGDIIDTDIQEKAMLDKAKIVVSTVPNPEDSIILINMIKSRHPEVKMIVNAPQTEYIDEFYKAGADLVIQPYKLAGQMLSSLIAHDEIDFE